MDVDRVDWVDRVDRPGSHVACEGMLGGMPAPTSSRGSFLPLALALPLLAACESRTVPSTWKDPRQGEKVARLEVSPDHADVAMGEQTVLQARAFDAEGRELTDVRFAWLDGSSIRGLTLVSPEAQEGKVERRFGPELVVEGLNLAGGSLEVAVADSNGDRINAVRGNATVAVHPGGTPTELLLSPPGETMSLAVGELRHVAAFVNAGNQRLPRSPLQFQVEGDCLELQPPQDLRDQQAVVRGRCEGTAKLTVSAPPLVKTLAVTIVAATQLTRRPPPDAGFLNPKRQDYLSPLLLLDAEDRPFLFFLSNQILLAQWSGTGWDVMPAHPYETSARRLHPTMFRLDPQGRPAFLGWDRGRLAYFRYDPSTGRFGTERLERVRSMEVISWGERDGRPGFWPYQASVSDGALSALAFDRKTGAELIAFTRDLQVPSVPEPGSHRAFMLASRQGPGFVVEPLPFVERKHSMKLPDREGHYSWPFSHHDFPPHLHDTVDGLGVLVSEPPPDDGYLVPFATLALRRDGRWRFLERRGPGKVASALGPAGDLHLFWRGSSYERPGGFTSDRGKPPANGYCGWDYSFAVDSAGRPHYLGDRHQWMDRYGDWRGAGILGRTAAVASDSAVVELLEEGCAQEGQGDCRMRVVHRRPAWDYASPAVRVVPGERTQQTGLRVLALDDGTVGVLAGQYRDPELEERGFAELTFQVTRDGVHFGDPVAVGGWGKERHDAVLYLAAHGQDVYALFGTNMTFFSASHDRGARFEATNLLECHPAAGLAVDGGGDVWLFTGGPAASGCGLRRSTDRGASFAPVPPPFGFAAANAGFARLASGELLAVAARGTTIDRSRRAPGADAWGPVESVDASPEAPNQYGEPFPLPSGDVYFARLVGVGPEATRTFVMRVLRWAAGASAVEVFEFPLAYDDRYLELRAARVFALPSGTYLSFTVSGRPLPFRTELRRLDGAKAGPPLEVDQGLCGGEEVPSAKRALQMVELGGQLQHFWIDGREAGFDLRQENLYTRSFEVQR